MKLSLIIENYATEQIKFFRNMLSQFEDCLAPQWYEAFFANDNLRDAQRKFSKFKIEWDSFFNMHTSERRIPEVYEELLGRVQKYFFRPIDDWTVQTVSGNLDDLERYRLDHFLAVAQAIYQKNVRNRESALDRLSRLT